MDEICSGSDSMEAPEDITTEGLGGGCRKEKGPMNMNIGCKAGVIKTIPSKKSLIQIETDE